jgi:DNA-binding transcriptional ArsR family regulator
VPLPVYQVKADLFRTRGHPVRIRVLELLQDGPKPVGDLLTMIEVEPSNLSVLRRAGLVASAREASLPVCSLSTPDVVDLLAAARRILAAMLSDRDGLLVEPRTGQRS